MSAAEKRAGPNASRSLKVAFPFVGDGVGGSHISAVTLMKALSAQGFEPVALVHRDGPLLAYLEEAGITARKVKLPLIDRAGGLRGLLSLIFVAVRLSVFLRQEDFCLVHANDGRMIHSWMPAARLSGIPGIAHRRTRWVRSRLSDWLHGLAGRIVVISEFVAESMPEDLRHKARTILNPVTIPPEFSGHTENSKSVVFIGTLQEQKRPFDFLEAASAIAARDPDARFLMIGRETELIERLRETGSWKQLGERLEYTGYRSDVPELLGNAGILLAPAEDEGHGRTLIEAMLLGVPVIASNSGGHREIVTDGVTGILVELGDTSAMCDAALDLMTNRIKRQRLVEAARDWAQRNFSAEHHARQIAGIYRELCPA